MSAAGSRADPGTRQTIFSQVSVIVPARNEERNIRPLVAAVRAQRIADIEIEVVVVDDGSTDQTAAFAAEAGAHVVAVDPLQSGNPAAARNKGAIASRGDLLVFLDANCVPGPEWLQHLLEGYGTSGAEAVGGPFSLPDGLSFTARCDYYCGWYHVHPRRPAGFVTQHPPGNLSVRRESFLATSGYDERQPIAYSHEELRWQAELLAGGGRIYFEPTADVAHYNRTGLGNLLRRNYRWGYSAIQSKKEVGNTRFPWLYRYPVLPILLGVPLAPATALYIVYAWARSGSYTPLVQLPLVLLARLSYGVATTVGGIRWLLGGQKNSEFRPKWE